jgi:hypothetical protein
MPTTDAMPLPTTEQVRVSLAYAEEYLRGIPASRADLGPLAWMYSPERIAFAREHVAWANDFLRDRS